MNPEQLREARRIRENGQFALKQIDGGYRNEAAYEDVVAYAKQLEAANARHVLNHIENICEVCGHTKTEDGCANCIRKERDDQWVRKEKYDKLREQKVAEVTPALVMDYAKVQQERDQLKQQLADANNEVSIRNDENKGLTGQLADLQRDKERFEMAEALWSATFQKYQSLMANGQLTTLVSIVAADYEKCRTAIDEAMKKATP